MSFLRNPTRYTNRKNYISSTSCIESLEERQLMTADLVGPFAPPEETIRIAGDADVNGRVDFRDYLILSSNIGLESAGWRDGDFNGDGNVGFDDFLLLSDKFGDNAHLSIDGTGNNRLFEYFGGVDQPLVRLTEPAYADGSSSPSGAGRPGPREISNAVLDSPGDIENTRGLSDLFWLFGQFLDHDITLSEAGDGGEALSIPVPQFDAEFDPFGTGEVSIGFTRTEHVDINGVRQQFNEITAFIDGSAIYGSDVDRANALRSFEGGRLLTSRGGLLPFNEDGLPNANPLSGRIPDNILFLAGDVRANENPGLTAFHTLFVREHNRVADEIAGLAPDWTDEAIFQRARQIVSGKLQAITFNEFLPALLGEDALSSYEGYDSSVNPGIANEFSTAAYRFGHTMLSSELLRVNPDGTPASEGNLALRDAFFNPGPILSFGIDSLLAGASVQTAQEIDPFLIDGVRNMLFGPPGSGGSDLAALNIQRGRDHGLTDYNQMRVELGLGTVDSFSDISSDPEIQRRLASIYDSVDEIDPWVGMLAEDHVSGAGIGATARTIILDQFERLRDGDRNYYENLFSGMDDLIEEIGSTTLADIIERNTDIDFEDGRNVFFAAQLGGTTIDSPSVTNAELTEPGEVDVYRVYVEAGVNYTFETELQTLFDSVLTLRDDFGNELAFDDDGGDGLASRIAWTAPTSGVVELEVAGFSDLVDFGTYRLKVSSAITAALSLNEVDVFPFDLEAGQTYVFETSLLTLGDSVLTLRNENGDFVASDDDGAIEPLASRLLVTPNVSGTYSVEVSAYSPGLDFGAYVLTASPLG